MFRALLRTGSAAYAQARINLKRLLLFANAGTYWAFARAERAAYALFRIYLINTETMWLAVVLACEIGQIVGASIAANPAVNAAILVNDVIAILGVNRVNGAAFHAPSAANAFIGNFVCHVSSYRLDVEPLYVSRLVLGVVYV